MDNRSNILACALRLFSARGYDAVGVQEIVEEAGITKPTLYHYFGSKRGLLNALLEEHFVVLNTSLFNAADYHGDLPYTLKQVASALFEYAASHPQFYRLALGLWFAPQESESNRAVGGYFQVQYEVLESVFVQATVQHGNMRNRQRAYATTFLGTINTYIGMALNGYVQLNDAITDQAVKQFQYGIYS